MTVDAPLVTLGQAKPAPPDRGCLGSVQTCPRRRKGRRESSSSPGPSARESGLSHARSDRSTLRTSPADPRHSAFQVRGSRRLPRCPGRISHRLLFGSNFVEAAVDAVSESAQLLFCEPPFCSSTFRRIDARTSLKASAIRTPGGWSGPPWSSLRIPRTAAQSSSTTAPAASASGAGEGVSAGPVFTGVGASGSPSARHFDSWAPCRLSMACSIFRRPRTFFRIGTLAWLSASKTGLATSRRKCTVRTQSVPCGQLL